jgi:hypothetical protein
VKGYQPVPGAWPGIPRADPWWLGLRGADGKAPTDRELVLIDRYLRAYRQGSSMWTRLAVLGQLYFLSDHWLKDHGAKDGAPPGDRERKVGNLFLSVAEELCKELKCSVNTLPQMIEVYWGRALTPGGYNMDNEGIGPGQFPSVANYLFKAEREKFLLTFKDGRAWQVPWWRPRGPYDRVPAESAQVGWTYAPGKPGQMFEPGFAGFVLSMGRDFYMADHHGCYRRDNFFHSSYLAGTPVLCAGSMLIHNGKVLWIKNDSGHYKPTLDHLVNVVQALEMYGIAPSSIWVRAVRDSWKDERTGALGTVARDFRGDRLLRLRGEGLGPYGRKLANLDNIRARHWFG